MGAGRRAIALAGGAAAGGLGTLAMDLVWFRRSRAAGDDSTFGEWESTAGAEGFDEAGAPAEVGRRAAATVGVEVPEQRAGEVNDAVHWLTGTGWGMGGAALAEAGVPAPLAGVAAGVVAFGAAYAVLPAMGLYDPVWEYDGKTLAKDASAHLTYGAATGLGLTLLGSVLGGRRGLRRFHPNR
jgi:hypothetical protein